MAAENVSISGIDYYTLLEHPAGSSSAVGSKGCVLLVHAIMSNLHMWDSTVASLHGAGYSVLRIDHVGHNKTPAPSAVPSGPYTIDTICQHLHAIAHQRLAGRAPTAIVGCSIGGVIALRYGMLFVDEGTRIVSITAPGIKSPDGFGALWGGRVKAFEEDVQKGSDRLAVQTVERWFPGEEPMDRKAREEELPRVRTCTLQGYRMLAGAISDFNYAQGLGKIEKNKCLVVAGGKDTASKPDVLSQIADEIPGSRFQLLEAAGHLPPVHATEAFDALLLSFLE